jgi:GNAT superfamily N-acetyltransferase
MKISIRKFARTDIQELVQFQQELARESEGLSLDADVVQKGMEAMFEDSTKGMYYVAIVDGEIAGCHMITYEWSDWRNGWTYWLQSVYVKPDYRKHGIFTAMFNHLKNLVLNDSGIAGVRLYVDKTNERAQKVYAAMGMNGDHYTVFEWMK